MCYLRNTQVQNVTTQQYEAAPTPTILVVDDDERIQRVLVARLKDAGFATRTADDGETALAACREKSTRPDLVILDVMMPGKDGFQVCHEIKESRETRAIPVPYARNTRSSRPSSEPR